MKYHFFKLRISKVRHETKDAVTIIFDLPNSIKEHFHFLAGQYLTLRFEIDGIEHRRAYSIISSPELDEPLAVTVKRTDNGVISNYIHMKMKQGAEIDVMPPDGNFTVKPNENKSKHYFLFAAGSGITPIYSILKTVLTAEPNSKLSLIYSNKDENSIIFKDDLEQLTEKHPENLDITHILSHPMSGWEGLQGRINEQTAEYLIKSKVDDHIEIAEFYVCGPAGFMDSVNSTLNQMNISEEKIHFESFTAPVTDGKFEDSEDAKLEITSRQVTVRIYGEEHLINVEPEETILTTAIAAGLNPPFSCQVGACSTCRARLISGKVHMDARDALTDNEIEEGFVLTCQSHPLTDDVFVDYDNNK